MSYLLAQILLFLILAAVVGFFIGWVIRGFGFESRLISSENQWRAKHHVLQGENHRLQDEVRTLKDKLKKAESATQITAENNHSLPQPNTTSDNSPSNPIQQAIADTLGDEKSSEPDTLGHSHPLDRLRSQLADIEEGDQDDAIPGKPPAPLIKPLGEVDDLKKISGIGPKIENTLNDLGIYHFQQIAEFDDENIIWVNQHLNFKGRIEREKWVEQAREIVAKMS